MRSIFHASHVVFAGLQVAVTAGRFLTLRVEGLFRLFVILVMALPAIVLFRGTCRHVFRVHMPEMQNFAHADLDLIALLPGIGAMTGSA